MRIIILAEDEEEEKEKEDEKEQKHMELSYFSARVLHIQRQ